MVNPILFQNLPKFYKRTGITGHELKFRKVRGTGAFQSKNESYQLLCSMRDGDVVVLALCSFLGEVIGKSWIPMADILGCVVKGIA